MDMERKDLRGIIEEIGEVAGLLWEKGWAERNAGNISVNITGLSGAPPINPDEQAFLVTGSGTRMRQIAQSPVKGLCTLAVHSTGTLRNLSESSGDLLPTSELPTHLAIHAMLLQENSEIRAVVHTHCTELIALTQLPAFQSTEALNHLLWGMHPETMLFVTAGAGFIPYQLPGTVTIAEKSAEALKRHPVVIWEKHGVIATGKTVTEAFDMIDLLAKSAKIYFLCKSTGVEPEGLTISQVNEIRASL